MVVCQLTIYSTKNHFHKKKSKTNTYFYLWSYVYVWFIRLDARNGR